jgi:hypothetical protein
MKYLITEKQLKTLRKYMKSFINEGYDDNLPLGAAKDPRNPENKSYGLSDEDTIYTITDNNGKVLVTASYSEVTDEIHLEDIYNENVSDEIINRLRELQNNGALSIVFSDSDTITYQELMDRSSES